MCDLGIHEVEEENGDNDDEDKKNKILAPDYIAEENIFIEKFMSLLTH